MSRYEVNFKRLALLMLPTFLRKPVIAALAYAAVSPVNYLQAKFVDCRNDTIYRLTHNGQACYLAAVLNDQFDPIDRRITITENPEGSENSFIFQRECNTNDPVPLRENNFYKILNRRGFGGAYAYDFWVNVPRALYEEIDTNRLKAVVNTYKLASKRFALNYK